MKGCEKEREGKGGGPKFNLIFVHIKEMTSFFALLNKITIIMDKEEQW